MISSRLSGRGSARNRPPMVAAGAGIVKARVVYGEKGIEDLSYSPYAVRHMDRQIYIFHT